MLTGLNKLLRYEFKFYFRIMPPFYLALVLAALAAGFQIRFSPGADSDAATWIMVIWICVFTAAAAVNFILVIQRFRDNLLRDPGYLMLTLPVGPWTLIASKAAAALSVSLMSILTGAASLFVLAAASHAVNWNLTMWREVFLNILLREDPAYIALYAVSMLILIFQQICLIYSVMTASQMLPRFRAIAAFIAYIAAASLVQQIIPPVLAGAIVDRDMLVWSIVLNFLFAALFFWLSGFLLKRTLNLE
ncbi:MAG: hypothetical protein LBC88_09970 [Spirochaetaceae bacterium]|jgi:hypothetical protein|nr:hypothetical protein [Spirochaetaceae bacterium]